MRRILRLVLVGAALVLASVVVAASPVAAQDCGGGGDRDDNGAGAAGYCEGAAPGRPPSGTSGRDVWNAYCGHVTPYRDGLWVDFYHELTLGDDPEDWDYIVELGYDPSGLYGGYVVFCMDGDEIISQWDYVWFTLRPPRPPTEIRDDAAARIDPPPPSLGSNPPFNERPSIVQFQTWLWINDPWEVIEEQETEGLVTVDVEAAPLYVDWTFSDGATVRCDGPGIPWSESTDAAGTYCQHTFTSSSADQPNAEYTASATVTWEFSWWLNGRPMGAFATLDMTTGFTLQVGEIQAVESGG